MTEIELTDNQKIQILQRNPKTKVKWDALSREDKQEILEGMDISVDTKWILDLLEDIKDK